MCIYIYIHIYNIYIYIYVYIYMRVVGWVGGWQGGCVWVGGYRYWLKIFVPHYHNYDAICPDILDAHN